MEHDWVSYILEPTMAASYWDGTNFSSYIGTASLVGKYVVSPTKSTTVIKLQIVLPVVFIVHV